MELKVDRQSLLPKSSQVSAVILKPHSAPLTQRPLKIQVPGAQP